MFQSNNGDKTKIDENNSEGIKKRTRGRRKRKNDRKKESKAKEIESKATKETKQRKERMTDIISFPRKKLLIHRTD